MWIDNKTDFDGRWVGTIYYLIKQYGRWIGTIYGGDYVGDYQNELNFERFI